MDSELLEDDEYIFQLRYPRAIFSYKTALNILEYIHKELQMKEVTINSKKRVLGNYKVHYVSYKYYDIGIIEVADMFYNPITVYNIERCICDMLRSNDFDLELQNSILHEYFKSKEKDIDKLLEYSKTFNIYDKVSTLVNYAVR